MANLACLNWWNTLYVYTCGKVTLFYCNFLWTRLPKILLKKSKLSPISFEPNWDMFLSSNLNYLIVETRNHQTICRKTKKQILYVEYFVSRNLFVYQNFNFFLKFSHFLDFKIHIGIWSHKRDWVEWTTIYFLKTKTKLILKNNQQVFENQVLSKKWLNILSKNFTIRFQLRCYLRNHFINKLSAGTFTLIWHLVDICQAIFLQIS